MDMGARVGEHGSNHACSWHFERSSLVMPVGIPHAHWYKWQRHRVNRTATAEDTSLGATKGALHLYKGRQNPVFSAMFEECM